MTKYIKKVNAITFDELVEHGKNTGGNMVDGMPWSFDYLGHAVSHENDQCYIICTPDSIFPFSPDELLVTDENGKTYSVDRHVFEFTFKAE